MLRIGAARRYLSTAGSVPSTFQHLGVPDFWCERLSAAGLRVPTETQALSLPPLLAGRSAILRAETGSGKTLAYLLPILESLRQRLAVHDPATQLLPVGLVVAPSELLVSQVCSVARALYPEYANMVLPCHGQVGAVRRRNAGLLVSTPLAALEAIHSVHYSALRYLVLDEVDALLSGAFKASMRSGLLPRMKQMQPEARPAHIFCAATLPAKGSDSAHAWLDKWYPQPDTLRLVTQGSHSPLANILQTFWQVDSSLPLSSMEQQSKSRAVRAAMQLASKENLLGEQQGGADAAAAAAHLEEEEEEEEEEEGEEEVEEEEEDVAPALAPARKGKLDTIARNMEDRRMEDVYLQQRVEEERHTAKVFAVTQLAVYEALLLPAKRLGLLSEDGRTILAAAAAAGEAAEAAAAPPPAAAPSPPTPPRPASSTLQDLQEGMAPSRQKARARKAAATREAVAHLTIDSLQALPCTGLHTAGAPGAPGAPAGAAARWLHPYTPPADFAPQPLTPASQALVPPTLVFVNSTAAAGRLRAWLSGACGAHFAVAELCAGLAPAVRGRRLEDFEAGRVRVLVCTNMAARGVDFGGAAHVIQAEFAQAAEGHLHRMGRTARAGKRGMVTSMVTRGSLALAEAVVGPAAAGGGSSSSGGSMERAFSSRQSFSRARKRREVVDAALALALASDSGSGSGGAGGEEGKVALGGQ